MYSSKKVSNSPTDNSQDGTFSSKRTTQVVLNNSVLIEEVTFEQKTPEPMKENFDITWQEWYTDVSDDDSDEEWLESFLLGPKITEVGLFDDICAQLEEVTNAVIEEFEGHEAFNHQPNKRHFVTFREYFYFEE